MIVIFSALISGWTSLLLLSNSDFNPEIKEVVKKMYLNQKDFVFNVKDLSILLVQDANQRFVDKNHDVNPFNNAQTRIIK